MRQRTVRYLHGHGKLPADRDAVRYHLAHRGNAPGGEDLLRIPATHQVHRIVALNPTARLAHRESERVDRICFDRNLDCDIPDHQYIVAQVQEGLIGLPMTPY